MQFRNNVFRYFQPSNELVLSCINMCRVRTGLDDYEISNTRGIALSISTNEACLATEINIKHNYRKKSS